jgi:hypothetical protein
LETAQAQLAMLEGRDPENAATLGIGPAGEQRIPSAAIFTEGPLYRCFGRGGAGAVMGSKNLKGFVVTGDGEVKVESPDRFESLKKNMVKLLKTDFKGWADVWRRYETASDLEKMNNLGILPTRNWQTGQFEGWSGIDKSTTHGMASQVDRAGLIASHRDAARLKLKRDFTRGHGVISNGRLFMPSDRPVVSLGWNRLLRQAKFAMRVALTP